MLDSRFAVDWVIKNIKKYVRVSAFACAQADGVRAHRFGGNPHNIAIAGQSGGGGAIRDQLILYDGKKPNFQKAIPRSIQRSPAYTLKALTPRNDAFAAIVGCNASAETKQGAKQQLKCMRNVEAETLRLAALNFSDTTAPTGCVLSVGALWVSS